jgi:hypothetical protein
VAAASGAFVVALSTTFGASVAGGGGVSLFPHPPSETATRHATKPAPAILSFIFYPFFVFYTNSGPKSSSANPIDSTKNNIFEARVVKCKLTNFGRN